MATNLHDSTATESLPTAELGHKAPYADEKAMHEKDGGESITAIEREPDQILAARNTFLGKLYKRAFSMGVEARGVERVLEDDRSPKNALNNLLMWFSVNTGKAVKKLAPTQCIRWDGLGITNLSLALSLATGYLLLTTSPYNHSHRCLGSNILYLNLAPCYCYHLLLYCSWMYHHGFHCHSWSSDR